MSLAEAPGPGGTPGGLRGTLTAAADLFTEHTAGLIAGRLERVLAAVAAAPGARLRDIEVLSAAERAQLVSGWNDTAAAVPGVPAVALFEAQAAATPDAVAVVCGGRR